MINTYSLQKTKLEKIGFDKKTYFSDLKNKAKKLKSLIFRFLLANLFMFKKKKKL